MNLQNILLTILGIIVIIGIIRVIIKPSNSILDFIADIFLLDVFGDILTWIFETIFE